MAKMNKGRKKTLDSSSTATFLFQLSTAQKKTEPALAADAYLTFIARIHQVHISNNISLPSFATTYWAELDFLTNWKKKKKRIVQD